MATGKVTFKLRTAFSTFIGSCSNENSGVCTPTTTKPALPYLAAQFLRYGSGRNELMQVYVQKLIRTTFPRSSFVFKGTELSHPIAPPKSRKRPSLCEAAAVLAMNTARFSECNIMMTTTPKITVTYRAGRIQAKDHKCFMIETPYC